MKPFVVNDDDSESAEMFGKMVDHQLRVVAEQARDWIPVANAVRALLAIALGAEIEEESPVCLLLSELALRCQEIGQCSVVNVVGGQGADAVIHAIEMRMLNDIIELLPVDELMTLLDVAPVEPPRPSAPKRKSRTREATLT